MNESSDGGFIRTVLALAVPRQLAIRMLVAAIYETLNNLMNFAPVSLPLIGLKTRCLGAVLLPNAARGCSGVTSV
jgi:hypothetical protein